MKKDTVKEFFAGVKEHLNGDATKKFSAEGNIAIVTGVLFAAAMPAMVGEGFFNTLTLSSAALGLSVGLGYKALCHTVIGAANGIAAVKERKTSTVRKARTAGLVAAGLSIGLAFAAASAVTCKFSVEQMKDYHNKKYGIQSSLMNGFNKVAVNDDAQKITAAKLKSKTASFKI